MASNLDDLPQPRIDDITAPYLVPTPRHARTCHIASSLVDPPRTYDARTLLEPESSNTELVRTSRFITVFPPGNQASPPCRRKHDVITVRWCQSTGLSTVTIKGRTQGLSALDYDEITRLPYLRPTGSPCVRHAYQKVQFDEYRHEPVSTGLM